MSKFQAPTGTGASSARGETITHHPERHCFVSRHGDREAVLDYRLLADRGINFHHTYVPEKLRGQGIAEALVRAGLAWARQEGLRIEASCWAAGMCNDFCAPESAGARALVGQSDCVCS